MSARDAACGIQDRLTEQLDLRVLRGRFVDGAPRDPYDVLGLTHDASLAQARAAWRAAVKDSHPDVMIARGVPAEAVKLAQDRLCALNAAWEEISKARA